LYNFIYWISLSLRDIFLEIMIPRTVFLLSLALSNYILGAQPSHNAISRIQTHLDSLETTDHLSGVVLIARNGKVLFQKAYGYANLADSVRNTLNTRFNLASMNKMFTGLAIMQLVQEGRLSLLKKIGSYLPDYPNSSVKDSVTIEQLLTHTSGMGNFWEAHDTLAKEKFKSIQDYVPLFANQPLLFTPGAKFSYSNAGFMVLGLIIEKISGQNYFDYVRNNIYSPAGMHDTDAYCLDEVVPRIATGYTMSVETPGRWKNNTWSNVVKGTPAGGGYATAKDLLNFTQALQQHRLLNAINTAAYTAGRIKYYKGLYGYGFSEETLNGHKLMGHTGGHYGIANELMIIPDLNYVVIILTNGEVENYWETANYIKRQLVGPTPALDNYFFTRKACNVVAAQGFDEGMAFIKKSSHSIRESVIERIAYKFLFEQNTPAALNLFKLNLALFPQSSVGYYNLGEAYAATGNIRLAVEQYEKYLALEPGDNAVKCKVAKIRQR